MKNKFLIFLSVTFFSLSLLAGSDGFKVHQGTYASTDKNNCSVTVSERFAKDPLDLSMAKKQLFFSLSQNSGIDAAVFTLDSETGDAIYFGLCGTLQLPEKGVRKNLGSRVQYTYSCGDDSSCEETSATLVVDKTSGNLISVKMLDKASEGTQGFCSPEPKDTLTDINCTSLKWQNTNAE